MELDSTGKRMVADSENAIATFGQLNQLRQTVEELTELQLEVLRIMRKLSEMNKNEIQHPMNFIDKENALDEVADNYIMLSQIRIMFGSSDEDMQRRINRKLTKLESEMELC